MVADFRLPGASNHLYVGVAVEPEACFVQWRRLAERLRRVMVVHVPEKVGLGLTTGPVERDRGVGRGELVWKRGLPKTIPLSFLMPNRQTGTIPHNWWRPDPRRQSPGIDHCGQAAGVGPQYRFHLTDDIIGYEPE